jgi:hypothetical protein
MAKPKREYSCGHRGTSRECDRCEQANRLEEKIAKLPADSSEVDSLMKEVRRLRFVQPPPRKSWSAYSS